MHSHDDVCRGRYENVRFLTMLTSDSARLVVSHWNIGTATFLRR